jgi:cytochrome P450
VSPAAAPAIDADLYANAALEDSGELFARIREAGPVVYLPRHRMYALGRFEDVRAALRDDATFLSGGGVAANPLANALGKDTTLNSDGETHTARRRVLMRSLGAKALTAIEEPLAREAESVVDSLTRRERFEAAADFSSHLPVSVVSELVGLRASSERMLRWAAATFDGLGPVNRRSAGSMPRALSLLLYSLRLRPGSVRAGTWAASVFEAQQRGEVSAREARALVIDFVAPALDTTILATTHLLWVLAQNPEAWEELREDPGLIPAAVVENVRLASPIRGFTRTLARRHEIGGTELPEGARVVLLFGAANLDETQFVDPHRFDLHREKPAHLGWGNGPHACVGIHLAKLEMRALLEAMVPRVASVSAGPPVRLRNNTLQGIARMPATFAAV